MRLFYIHWCSQCRISQDLKWCCQAAKADVPADDKTAFRQFAALFTPGEHKFAVYDFEATLEVGLKVGRLTLGKVVRFVRITHMRYLTAFCVIKEPLVHTPVSCSRQGP